MSKYTTEVRFLCESLTGHDESEGYSSIDEIIEDALPIIFSFDFPIFDEEYREVLETKILRHYYTREIGCETYGLWKLRLQTKLNEIMPYYNKLYESELLKYDPLRDVDMMTQHTGQKTGERTDISTGEESNERDSNNSVSETRVNDDSRTNTFSGTRSSENTDTTTNASSTQGGSTNTNQDYYSDTPQGAITNVENGTYLTNYRKVADAGTNSSATDSSGVAHGTQNIEDSNTESSVGNNTTVNQRDESATGNDSKKSSSTIVGNSRNTEDYVMHVFGKSAGANYAKMIKDFRDNLLNIDMDIIHDLADLFMLIW